LWKQIAIIYLIQICCILAKHSILNKTERKMINMPWGHCVQPGCTRACHTLWYKASETRKDFGQSEGSLLREASPLGVNELLGDFAFIASPLWAWCPFLGKSDAEQYGW